MGHGNPDVNYSANTQVLPTSQNRLAGLLRTNKNIFVGTVDYGDMLFWPKERREKVRQIASR